MKNILLTTLLAALAATSAGASSASYVLASSLKPKSAQQDAVRDIKKGECNLYLLTGRPRSIPGTAMDEETASKKYKIIEVQGTSDALTVENTRLNRRAAEYATTYNTAMTKVCGN